MRTSRILIAAIGVCAIVPAQAPPPSAAIFRFEADEFWLNLHHFLYVLGRAEAHTRDASRAAVAGAPAEVKNNSGDLTEPERTTWNESVTTYAKGLSLKDAVFDESLSEITRSLADAGDARSLSGRQIDPNVRMTLERAAPIYRKVWWPKHQAANRAWELETRPLLDRHGPAILRFVTNAYQMQWPQSGYPVHLSAYSNWAGAYSTRGNLLVVATNPDAGDRGLYGLETLFHEAMHQWDEAMDSVLHHAAGGMDKPLPRDLSHALIFFTAGEAVRSVAPEHIPYADKFFVWSRGMMPLKEALEQTWKPYLAGHGSRDEALAALVAISAKQSHQ
jgi:hypothetical protein